MAFSGQLFLETLGAKARRFSPTCWAFSIGLCSRSFRILDGAIDAQQKSALSYMGSFISSKGTNVQEAVDYALAEEGLSADSATDSTDQRLDRLPLSGGHRADVQPSP